MVEKLECPSCGASLEFNNSQQAKCNYCGATVAYSNDLSVSKAHFTSADIEANTQSAAAFLNSLDYEVKGFKVSLTELWSNLLSNKKADNSKLLQFHKQYKKRILYCIELYKNLSNEIKYEIGSFICEQMESLIKFRKEHNLVYLDEIDAIDATMNKLKYDIKARGIFEFKAKWLILQQMKRVYARKAVVVYDYTMKEVDDIVSKYNSKLEPIKTEYQATAHTAFARRKELKLKIDTLEMEKKQALDKLNVKLVTKEFNIAVKKYKIEHVDLFKSDEDNDIIPAHTIAVKKVEIDYSKFTAIELLDGIVASLEKLSVAITKSEIENVKKSLNELVDRDMPESAVASVNIIESSINLILDKEQKPVEFKTLMPITLQNVKTQARTAKNALKK